MKRPACFHGFAALAVVLALVPGCKRKGFGGTFEGDITMHTTRAGSAAQDMTVHAKGDKLRFDMPAPDGKTSSAVYDPSANKLVMIMDAQRAYMDMDFSSPSAAPNTDPRTSAVEKTGKTETIAGLDCEIWTVKDPSGKRSEVCNAEGLAFFDLEGVRHGGGAAWNKDLRDKKYFPLRSVEYDAGGKETSRSEVTKIEAKKLDDALFTVPKDFTRLPTPPMK
jgi:hypothetical protein